jgi:hypothetical protein
VLIHDRGETLQSAIARQVTMEIVDAFQPIDVQQENRKRVLTEVSAADCLLQPVQQWEGKKAQHPR